VIESEVTISTPEVTPEASPEPLSAETSKSVPTNMKYTSTWSESERRTVIEDEKGKSPSFELI
jgi:hypothetical protein